MFNRPYRDNFINDSDKPNERQMSAENYLKEYNIEEILTEMINYLLHKKSKSPVVAMIKYLGGLLTEEERKEYKLEIPDPQIDYHPIVDYPEKYDRECNSLLKKHLNKEIFYDFIKKRSKYGIDIKSLLRVNNVFPKNNIGIMIGDADSLIKFSKLYNPIICEAHNLQVDPLKDYIQNYFNLPILKINDIKKVDISKIEGLKKISFSISRNLSDSPFVCFINIENRTEKIINQLNELNKNPIIRNLENETEINKIALNKFLMDINYDFNFLNAVTPNDNLIKKQRKIYFNADNSLIILINFCDNLQIIRTIDIIQYNKKNENKLQNKYDKKENNKKDSFSNEVFIKYFNEFNDLIRNIQYYYGFEFNHNFGYLTSNIALLGRGFSISTEIDLDKFYKDDFENIDKLKEKFNKFDMYTDSYNIKKNENDENVLIFTSSPKISEENFQEFLVKYFEKIQSLKNNS